jgi:hypothetical protein
MKSEKTSWPKSKEILRFPVRLIEDDVEVLLEWINEKNGTKNCFQFFSKNWNWKCSTSKMPSGCLLARVSFRNFSGHTRITLSWKGQVPCADSDSQLFFDFEFKIFLWINGKTVYSPDTSVCRLHSLNQKPVCFPDLTTLINSLI